MLKTRVVMPLEMDLVFENGVYSSYQLTFICCHIQIDHFHKSILPLNQLISFITNIHNYSHKTPSLIFSKWTTSLNGLIECTTVNGRLREVLL